MLGNNNLSRTEQNQSPLGTGLCLHNGILTDKLQGLGVCLHNEISTWTKFINLDKFDFLFLRT